MRDLIWCFRRYGVRPELWYRWQVLKRWLRRAGGAEGDTAGDDIELTDTGHEFR